MNILNTKPEIAFIFERDSSLYYDFKYSEEKPKIRDTSWFISIDSPVYYSFDNQTQ